MRYFKIEMFTGRMVTDKILHSKQEADHENKSLIENKSTYRWVGSLVELGKFERESKNGNGKQ